MTSNLLRLCLPIAFITALLSIQCTKTGPQTLLIQNATIIDGTESDRFIGAVRILDDRIVEIGTLTPKASDSIIDGTGLVLAPGFIDTHSHHDWDTLRTIEAAISQGITSIIVGQDGFSKLDLEDIFDFFEANPLSVNIGSYVGHNSIRLKVMGEDFKREATEDEIRKMEEMVKAEMQNGALGLSTGLEYDPGIYSNTDEVVSLAKIAAQHGGRYISHMRSEDVYFEKSIEEILQIGQEANIPVQISHFKLARRGLWGKAANVLAKLDSARQAGIRVTADVYPYAYWQSTMTVLFPKRDFDNRESAAFALEELTSAEGMIISSFKAEPAYENLTLDSIAKLRKEDPVDTYMTLIQMSKQVPGESIIAKSMDLEDIKTLTRWSHSNICSDGAPTGHPRGWGAFPRYLNMDTGESLESKIHKMTAQGAENIGLDSIGKIKAGYYADLVLFDPDAFVDKATYTDGQQRSEGLKMVMVSGEIVYKEEVPTKVYVGRVLKLNESTQQREASNALH